jgi:hypothetical protein
MVILFQINLSITNDFKCFLIDTQNSFTIIDVILFHTFVMNFQYPILQEPWTFELKIHGMYM